jgi:nucleoside-diphosphate-sugar epimerase
VLLFILINGDGLIIFIKMKILITGSTGFLGLAICNILQKDNTLFGLSRSNSDYNTELQNHVPEFIDQFEIVIHAAGKAHSFPKNKFENDAFFNINVQGSQNLLKGLEQSNTLPKSFIFVSSVAVYGLDQGKNIDENTPLLAKDPYGLSKLIAEQLIIEWCNKNKVVCTIIRLPLLVGENPPGNLGAMIRGIQKGYYFNIAGGLVSKSMVLVEDVANILIKAAEIGGIYNLTDGYHPNFYELSNAIAKKYKISRLINLPFFIIKCAALAGDVLGSKFPINSNKLRKITSELTFDDTKARLILCWNPKKVLEYYDE